MTANSGIETTTMDPVPDREAMKRRELARFLKAMRDRTSPTDLGLAVSPLRRAPGLLREEVAQAAGISTTWYTRMEQARPANPSQIVLDGVARALRLDPAERAYLFRVARPDLQPWAPAPTSDRLNEAQAALLQGLAPHPAYALNARWDVIAWNRPAAQLLGDFVRGDAIRGNVLFRLFLDPDWRRLFLDWEALVRSAVEKFRATTTHLSSNPEFAAFIETLERASPKFSTLWNRQRVRDSVMWRKTLEHTEAGRLCFLFATFRAEGASDDVRFTIYTPADSETKRRFIALLASSSCSGDGVSHGPPE